MGSRRFVEVENQNRKNQSYGKGTVSEKQAARERRNDWPR
jgi:hypothetical protein